MAKIYISYNSKDREFAEKLTQELKTIGHHISIDTELLPAGQEWRELLTDALQSSDVFVSLLSDFSITSQYVLTELGTALALRQSPKKMLVIPVMLDDVEIPDVIRTIQVIFARDRDVTRVANLIDRAIVSFLAVKSAEEKQEIETKERIETNASEFIEEEISFLGKHEWTNRVTANVWYGLGYVMLVVGIVFGFYSIAQAANITDLQWIRLAYLGLKSAIVIGLLLAGSKYAFTLGKSYMSEALKCADRMHAISFGRFYLRAFGAQTNWTELKEVFQHWNIDKSSAFSTLDTNAYDPKFLETVIEVTKLLASKADIKK